ncbi:MAG TPA: hypothetical protein VGQ76_14470 [Thermoanaerobaculia bacterium]|nr:hypothetical protein [Thermoanaerobaculia bacterium]
MQLLRERLIRERGGLTLLALFERDGNRGRWDLMVAGGGFRPLLQDYEIVSRAIEETLSEEERLKIGRMVILSEDFEPVVKLIRRVQHVNGSGPVELENINFSQFLIRTALIFHAESAEVGAVHA